MNEADIIDHRPPTTDHRLTSCPICGSTNLRSQDTIISDFVMSRITDDFVSGSNWPVKLCFCNDCTFAFYDYRMTDEEVNRLYADFRDADYQKTRERYEYWYTVRINEALNNYPRALQDQRRVIEKVISGNIQRELKTGLDYGGNEGRTFTDMMGTQEKYVFDISGTPTIEGVKHITRYEDLKNYHFDFIMCNQVFEHLTEPMKMMQNFREIGSDDTVYYIEVPSENPFLLKAKKHSILRNLPLLFNPNLNMFKLARYYFHLKKYPPMQMREHINFFTKQSIRTMAEKSGFTVIDIQENKEHTVMGAYINLSILFKK